MRKAVVFPAVLLLLIVPVIGHAADLQAGWYVKIQGVNVYTYDYQGRPQLTAGGYFYSTPTGTSGPFLVTDPSHFNDARWVSVPTAAYGVGTAASLTMPLSIALGQGTGIAYLSISCVTNCDPTQIYLGLYRTRYDGTTETLWSQLDDPHGFSGDVAHDTVVEGPFYFKLNAVPEPSSLVSLILGCGCLTRLLRRRA